VDGCAIETGCKQGKQNGTKKEAQESAIMPIVEERRNREDRETWTRSDWRMRPTDVRPPAAPLSG
jgi:hypothetical protein